MFSHIKNMGDILMKLSDMLNIIASILTLLFMIFLVSKSYNTLCFNWSDYVISFSMLFTNITINILATIGR
jgi:hypothetical protein